MSIKNRIKTTKYNILGVVIFLLRLVILHQFSETNSNRNLSTYQRMPSQ